MDEQCEICGRYGSDFMPLHEHHVFGGNGYRKLSEQYGMKATLCYECHEGNKGVHRNVTLSRKLKRKYQRIFEQKYSREMFILVFGKSYL